MNRVISIALMIATTGVANVSAIEINIYNPAPFPRKGVVAEIPGEKILDSFGSDFIIYDANGQKLNHQVTHDGKILVEADVDAGSKVSLTIERGNSGEAEIVCLGQIRNDFQDDFTWENDRSGYRLYGPSYRKSGGNVAGYDIWTKSVDYPVLSQRYEDHCRHGISYHKDHGNGMDCYTVGRTLGAGMNALAPKGEIAYPCAYESCEILDNGPLRTTAKITCYPENIGDNKDVTEERIITLDKGSWLNKTSLNYKGLSGKTPLVTGIVVHKQNPHGVIIDPEKRFTAYPDLTDNPDNGNGIIYIGIVNAEIPDSCFYVPYDEAVGDAVGQILNATEISSDDTYTYYWGSGWSKGGINGFEDWIDKLTKFHESLGYPLEVVVKD